MAISHIKAKLQAATRTGNSQNLITWNKWLAALYALQAVAILLFSKARALPLEASYQAKDALASSESGTTVLASATTHLFDINMTYLVAAALLVAAIAHALAAFVMRKRYEEDLSKDRNTLRWVSYMVADVLLISVVALVCGVRELAVLVAIAGLAIGANAILLAVERAAKAPQWLLFWIAVAAGALPWIVIALYLWAAGMYDGLIPGYAYALFGTTLALFGAFAVNAYLLMKRTGQWKQYIHGERVYLILGLVLHTAVAWQMFAGLLRP
jgi:hypothetical protein